VYDVVVICEGDVVVSVVVRRVIVVGNHDGDVVIVGGVAVLIVFVFVHACLHTCCDSVVTVGIVIVGIVVIAVCGVVML